MKKCIGKNYLLIMIALAFDEDPCMKDIGILASLDFVAIDIACMDLTYNSNYSGGNDHFLERVQSRNI